MNIRAVIFDVGGVLVKTHDHGHRRTLEQNHQLPEGGSEAIVFNSEVGIRAQKGEISYEDLWNAVAERVGLDKTGLEEFRSAFWAGDAVDRELVSYIRALKLRYQTAIISNATDYLRQNLTENYRIADAFDLIVCSAEEKTMKPDPIIYQRALDRLGRAPGEAVFVDDMEANVEAARTVGLHAIKYRPGLNVPAVLAEVGVKPATDEEVSS